MKNTLNEEKIKDAIDDADKKTIEDTAAEGLQWLEGNQDADADAIEGKRKELEAKFNPIMMKIYQKTDGAGMPGANGMPGGRMPGRGAAGAGASEAGAAEAEVEDLD